MLELTHLDIDFKIAPPESLSIIGSNSIHTAGDLYVVNLNSIAKPANKRKKRTFDIFAASVFLVFSPFLVWIFKDKKQFFMNVLSVLAGSKTWIGYIPNKQGFMSLPMIKQGVLNPGDLFPDIITDAEKALKMNMLYARDYSLLTDTEILLKCWKNVNRKSK